MTLMFRTYFKIKGIASPLFLMFFLSMTLYVAIARAATPLVSDDTGTQGKGKSQIELLGEYGRSREEGTTSDTTGITAILTYGVIDTVDVILTVPYQFWRAEDRDVTKRANGFSDIAIESKWRFYEKEGWNLAIKPGFTLPAGDKDKELGNEKPTYYVYLIASKELDPWAFHLNLAYFRNENSGDDRNDILYASLASSVEIVKNFKLVGDIGVESNPDRSSTVPCAYVLGGFIYTVRENFDIGLGVKAGLTKSETDLAVRGGITWRF